MSDETRSLFSSDISPDQQLEAVLAEYLRRTEQGEQVDQAVLLAEHPDLASDLREFVANKQLFQRVVRSTETPLARPPPDRLRYFGDYEILEELAHGGMGVVYRARQTSLNRLVAVKMILAGQLAHEG